MLSSVINISTALQYQRRDEQRQMTPFRPLMPQVQRSPEGGGGGTREPVWPGAGKALVRLVSRRTSVRIRFGSPFSSKTVVCAHCLVCDFVPHN